MKVDTSDIPEAGEDWFRRARLVAMPIRQSELQRAREHLFMRQSCLGFLRKKYAEAKWPGSLAVAEADVLAALSWVWDAQERAGLNRDVVTPVRVGPGIVVMFVNKGARGDG